MHDVCAIVVSHNSRRWVETAIASLLGHTGSSDCAVVLVDNGSDGTADYVRARFPQVRAVRCPNRGFAHANNLAQEYVSARYVLFLNPDTTFVAGQLDGLVMTLDRRVDIGLVGVRQLRVDGKLAPSIRRYPAVRHTLAGACGVEYVPIFNRFLGERDVTDQHYNQERECDWTSGSFMLARRAALDEVGWFDERFFLFSEEVDLCLRMKRAGWKIVHMPTLTICHVGSDASVVSRLASQETYARMQFARKHFGRLHQHLYRLALAWESIVRLTYCCALRKTDRRHAAAASLRTVLENHAPMP